MRKKRALALALYQILILFSLSACQMKVPIRQDQNKFSTLPPATSLYKAPVGDAQKDLVQNIQLYLPLSSSGQYGFTDERIQIPAFQHPALRTIKKLFSYSKTTQASPLCENITLQLNTDGLEMSGDTVSLSLQASALALSAQELYAVAQAAANTLSQWGDIRYVNLLLNGQQMGIDNASTLPMGSLQEEAALDPQSAWEALYKSLSPSESKRFSMAATLYFPTAGGRGILAEGRTLHFQSTQKPQMALTLLKALSSGPQQLGNLPKIPDLNALLAEDPSLVQLPNHLGTALKIHFTDNANEVLIQSGIPRSLMIASICYTLTTFIPGLAGIQVDIGNEPITSLVPAATYTDAGKAILFDQALIKRQDFHGFLLDNTSLFFSDAQGMLVHTLRPVPYQQSRNPRFLINQLFRGPQNEDSVQGLSPSLPKNLSDAELIGLAMEGDSALVHFSSAFQDRMKDYDEKTEQKTVYSLVNTLTKLRGIRRVRFFINGTQPDSFSGHLYLPGEFLENTGLNKAPNQ